MNFWKGFILVLGILMLVIFMMNIGSHFTKASNKIATVPLIREATVTIDSMHLVVLGIAQDAGYPQADCKKSCCTEVWRDKSKRKMVSCLGVRDPQSKKVYLFDATPDLKDQLQVLKNSRGNSSENAIENISEKEYQLGGIFLTHAHIGHYTGLMELGREVLDAKSIPTYVMPRMADFLSNNGPWDNLVKNNNIVLELLKDREAIQLSEGLSVTPLLVPHRDEYSETVGFVINGSNKKVLFIPDIDKWDKWSTNINELIKQVDYAFLDGTFFQNGEIWGRDMSQIPHPFISESIKRFEQLSFEDKNKIHFIHLNHTNPLLDKNSEEYKEFHKLDFNVASEFQVIEL